MNSWVRGQHALSTESTEAIRMALELGWVIGLHYYFGAAIGPDAIAFTSHKEYYAHILGSRPGDKFLLWSLGRLLQQRLPLLAVSSAGPAPNRKQRLDADDLARVETYLAAVPHPQENANEIFVSARIGNETLPSALVTDIDGFDEIKTIAHEFGSKGGEIYVLPLGAIEKPELLLLRVKRANDRGEVPLVGAY